MKINQGISCVLIQFSFPHDDMIPAGLNWISGENLNQRQERKSSTNGTSILQKMKTVSLVPLIDDLRKNDFVMVSATAQGRVTKLGLSYNVAKFIFVPTGNLNDLDKKFIENIFYSGSLPQKAFEELTHNFFWRVRGFSNPSTSNRRAGGRDSFWSINPESCTPSQEKMPLYYLTIPEGESPTYIPRDRFLARQ